MKKFKNLLSIIMSLIILFQICTIPSAYGIASNTADIDGNNDKSYEAMLNAIV